MAAAKESRTLYQETPPPRCSYRFGAFFLDPYSRVLTRAGKTQVLPPKVFDTLVALVESAGHPVENQTLMTRIWPGVPFDENLLKFHVAQVKMALGDDKSIQALPPKGYRFIADLERIETGRPALPVADVPENGARPAGFGKHLWSAVALAVASLAFVTYRSFDWAEEPLQQHPVRSIAVAPFTGKGADEAMAAAISKGLIPRLQSIPGMTVQLGTGGSGIDAVLSGSLERTAAKVIANVKLVPVSGGPEIFSETFDIPPSQIFSIEPIVAKRVAIALKSRLTPAQEANLLRLPTQNSEAYRLFSELPSGRGAVRQRITALEKVIALDPEYAPAHAELAEAYRTLAFSIGSNETLEKSKVIAQKAVTLDATLPEAQVALGYASLYLDWNADAAAKAAQHAFELAPNSSGARALTALLLTTQSKFDAALAEWKKVPDSDETRYAVALTNYYARRYDRAIEEYRSAIVKAPPVASAVQMLARCLRLKGRKDEAFAEYTRADVIGNAPGRAALKQAFEEEGWPGYWQKKLGMRWRMGSYEVAAAFIEGGKEWRAFKPLYKAFETKSPEMIFVHLDPVMDPIREDSRFKNMVREIGIAK